MSKVPVEGLREVHNMNKCSQAYQQHITWRKSLKFSKMLPSTAEEKEGEGSPEVYNIK